MSENCFGVFNGDYYSDNNRIIIRGSINEEVAKNMVIKLNSYISHSAKSKQEQKELTITIDNSTGGDLRTGLSIYSQLKLIKQKGVKLTTIALNRCMSAATVIFMAGDERFSSEYTDFLIHNVTINGTDMTTKDLESLINESTRLNSELAKIYSIVGGKKTIAEISQVMNEDKKIIATEAAELGLVTEIF